MGVVAVLDGVMGLLGVVMGCRQGVGGASLVVLVGRCCCCWGMLASTCERFLLVCARVSMVGRGVGEYRIRVGVELGDGDE